MNLGAKAKEKIAVKPRMSGPCNDTKFLQATRDTSRDTTNRNLSAWEFNSTV